RRASAARKPGAAVAFLLRGLRPLLPRPLPRKRFRTLSQRFANRSNMAEGYHGSARFRFSHLRGSLGKVIQNRAIRPLIAAAAMGEMRQGAPDRLQLLELAVDLAHMAEGQLAH